MKFAKSPINIGRRKKGYLQWFGKIELSKPKVWTQRLFFQTKIFFAPSTQLRVFIRALFLASPSSSSGSCVHLKEENRSDDEDYLQPPGLLGMQLAYWKIRVTETASTRSG
jgi:hypothetical protein